MPMNGSKMAAALHGRIGILRLRCPPSRGERFFIRAAIDVEAGLRELGKAEEQEPRPFGSESAVPP